MVLVDPGRWWGWRPLVQFAACGAAMHLAKRITFGGVGPA